MNLPRNGTARWLGFALAFLAQFGLIVWHSARTISAIEQLQKEVAGQSRWQAEAQRRLEDDALNLALLQARVTAHEKAMP